MNYIKKVNNVVIFFILALTSFLISYTYYFDHLAIVNTLVQYNDEIYRDKTNLFYLMQASVSSFLFVIINFLIKIGFSINFLNISLTFVPTLLNLSGVYLICKFITSSTFLSILISITAITLSKNFGDVDYPTLMFSWHTAGIFALSLSTFILGLLTLRNLQFAFLTCLLLLSVHLVVGLWMIGITALSSYFLIKKRNFKKIGFTIFILLVVLLFHGNSIITTDIPFEFNQKDYDNYFYYIEAHRTNYGDSGNLYFDYTLKSFILLTLIFFYLKFDFSNIENNNNLFFITISISIICSGIIFLVYKIFPQIFPDIAIRIIPARFVLIHSIVGYPIIISIIYKFLERFFINKKLNKNFSLQLISLIIIFYLFQQLHVIEKRFDNIKIIKENKIKENLFWNKVKNLKLRGYILTSNDLCHKTVTYTYIPILFCFDQLDYVPYLPKLATPVKKITRKILGISYNELKYKNLGGISESEIKKIFENKSSIEWNIIKKDSNLNTIIVPKDWNLDLSLILEDKYKVYRVE